MLDKILINKHALIVEDDEASRLLVETMLSDIGCSFDVATNGQEAVDLVRRQQFDIALMDIRMPLMNGYEAAKAIRAAHKDLPIIALTAHALPWIEERYRECGMNGYLAKPFDQQQLLEMLLRWA
ncbi:MAG: response regulator [Candidatus Omnitrophica bacterium]|nr:response regulator [Candidatus Omnitrophota bacterium]